MLPLPLELQSHEIALNVDVPPDTESSMNNQIKSWAVVGQDRAVKALEMGISIRAKGYNIFVVGEFGIGKHTAILGILDQYRKKNGTLRDIVYVQNFQDPDKPRHLIFPGGSARKFKEDMALLLKRLEDRMTRNLDTESYKAKKATLIHEVEKIENKKLAEFESQVNSQGFRIIHTEDAKDGEAMDIAPVIDGKIVRFDDLQDKVPAGLVLEETWTETRERYFVFMNIMNRIYRELKGARETLQKTLKDLKRDTVRKGVEEECTILADRWTGEDIKNHLDAMIEDVIEHTTWFSHESEEEEEEIDLTVHYGVNIVLDSHGVDQLPVIYETNPTKINFFGSIEARYDVSGELRTNMMMIKAGSLLRADGGFLILQAEDVFSREGLWPELKRVLQTGFVVPEIQSTPLGPLPILMKPEPIVAETKVILVGPEKIYEALCSQDDEFFKLFKITAEFSPVMIREAKTEKEYAAFTRELASKENLRPVSPDGIQEIIAYGVQLSERRDRLSTHFSLIGDLIRESDYTAEHDNKPTIDGAIVRKAIAYREYISNLPEKELMEQIANGTIIIDIDGHKIGMVNGLAVLEKGAYSFGIPLRITVTVSPGKEGLINIERESGLSGELHDKGVLLLEGYLRHRFVRRHNLSLTGSIAVEQSYYEIDGDSASVAELAALLSAIAELPIRQDIAVTGAVNQLGDVQPVGSVQKKIQGFFQVCEGKGFTGQQGVIIPYGNINSVILPAKIVNAVDTGQFHIWAAKNIDEVMVLLSGLNAGKEYRSGRFEAHSINRKIKSGLMELTALS